MWEAGQTGRLTSMSDINVNIILLLGFSSRYAEGHHSCPGRACHFWCRRGIQCPPLACNAMAAIVIPWAAIGSPGRYWHRMAGMASHGRYWHSVAGGGIQSTPLASNSRHWHPVGGDGIPSPLLASDGRPWHGMAWHVRRPSASRSRHTHYQGY